MFFLPLMLDLQCPLTVHVRPVNIKKGHCWYILCTCLFCIPLKWHSQKACGAAITCRCLSVNHTATCKQQHTDEGGSSCSTYGKFVMERTLLLGEPMLCLGGGITFPCFQHRICEQECNVTCTGMGHVFINPA